MIQFCSTINLEILDILEGFYWTFFKTSFYFFKDPTSYKSIRATGRGARQLYDLNSGWKNVNAYLFKASYNDQPDIEFQVDPEINENNALDASTWLAEMYGRVPNVFRDCVKEFSILPGNQNSKHSKHLVIK